MKWRLLALILLAPALWAARGPGDPVPAGFQVFLSSSYWNVPVDRACVSTMSVTWLDVINGHAGHNLHADFGDTFAGHYNGIPYNLVGNDTPNFAVGYTTPSLQAESDPWPVGGIPVPTDNIIEGDPPPLDATLDRHLIIVDTSTYEEFDFYQASRPVGSPVEVEQYTHWNLRSNQLRTDGFTSADAAGLPVFPGLIRYDEITAGVITHAIRFTLSLTYQPHIWPARHDANSGGSNNPPFGMWVRLKQSFDISGYSATNQIILKAMKKYGMILADNGGDWYFGGAPNSNWDSNDLALFAQITAHNDFEVVDTAPMMIDPGSGAARESVCTRSQVQGSANFKGGVTLR